MSDEMEFEALDAALARLAAADRAARPRVDDALVARVLGDAADVSAERAPSPETVPEWVRETTREPASEIRGLWRLGALIGWPGSAVAVMATGLVLGIGLGYGLGEDAVMAGFGPGLMAELLGPEEMFLAEAVPF